MRKLRCVGSAFPVLVFAAFSSLPCSTLYAAQAFVESSGQVVMQGENFDNKVSRNGITWTAGTSVSGYSGSGYMAALPNAGITYNTGYTTNSPELVYNVMFTTTGTYYVWIRGSGPTGSDDSVHAGIDGTGPATADRISGFPTTWGWKQTTMDGPAATLVVSTAGLHTIRVWMREDGVRVDKILLRKSSSTTAPSGTGPAESARTTIGDTTPPTGSITINGGAAATRTTTVTLTLSASDTGGVTQMQFSNDGVTFSTPEPYATTKSWTLASGDGTKTVRAKFKDAAGNWSAPVSDTIVLDTTPPTLSFTSPVDGAVITAP